jgi:hypothetical protein
MDLIILITILILCIISGLLNATEDIITHKYEQSVFSKFNHIWFSKDSWKNKYINRDFKMGRIKWNILGISFNKPVQLTDWWHFSKMLSLTCYFIGIFLSLQIDKISFYGALLFVLFYGVARNISFRIFYHHILLLKNYGV